MSYPLPHEKKAELLKQPTLSKLCFGAALWEEALNCANAFAQSNFLFLQKERAPPLEKRHQDQLFVSNFDASLTFLAIGFARLGFF
ncbi:hypothetical protein NC651_027299 [Populus alba x Populus x berolinensis]|nr:hypothetical protein NC651_027299 [Populus alba x Populus x berolinensis]